MSERAGDDAQALRSGNEQGVRDAIAELQKPEVGHYRTLVLLGRLVQLAAVGHTIDARLLPAAWQGLLVDPQPMPALDELTARAVFPNEHELGLELLAECAAGEDAIASVQPVLLAIEDHLDVLSLLGLSERAALLVQTTVAAVALFPEVMSALGARAEIQLAGLSGRSEAATLWSAVLSASGWLAAAAMEVSPTLSREGRAYFHLAKQATKDAKPRGSFRLPLHVALPEWQRAAATTRASVDVPLLDADGVEVASLFLDSRDGHEKICLPLPAATPASLHISLLIYDRELRQERGRQQLITEQKGAELIADLGHPVGPSSIRHQLLGRRAADLPEHRVQFLIEVAQDVV